MARLLVTVSVALNFLLLTSMVAARVDSSRSQAVEAPAPDGARFANLVPVLESSVDVAGLYAALRRAGVGHAAARPLIGAWLAQRKAAALRREVVPYWRLQDRATERARAERITREAGTRRELISLYGGAATLDPYFAVLFEPLGPQFAFLTSEEQLAVQRALVGIDSGSGAGAGTAAGLPCHRSGGPSAQPAARFVPGADALGEAAAFEYGLRISPLATELRQARLDLTEAEFRAAFGLLAELDAEPTVATHARVRTALRDLLGTTRFDRLWSQRDPVYPEVVRVLQGRGLAPRVIEAAYAVMSRAQEKLLDAARQSGDPGRLGEAARRIVNEERLELEAVVGAAATRALLAARGRLAAGPQPPGCGAAARLD